MLGRIEHSMDEQRASEEALRRFLADASHELRTPLTSIRGYAELFRRGAGDDPADTALAMRRIEQESARMGVLVDDLLFLARSGRGRPIAREPVRPRARRGRRRPGRARGRSVPRDRDRRAGVAHGGGRRGPGSPSAREPALERRHAHPRRLTDPGTRERCRRVGGARGRRPRTRTRRPTRPPTSSRRSIAPIRRGAARPTRTAPVPVWGSRSWPRSPRRTAARHR